MTGRRLRPARLLTPPLSAADAAVVARHLDHMRQRGVAVSSAYQRGRALTRLAAVLPVPLLEADPALLADWRAGLVMGDDSVNNNVGAVREFYRWAVAGHLIESSPAAALPMPRRTRRLPRPIAEADLLAALQQAPERIRPWLVLAGWAGLRAKEIAFLRSECVLDTAQPPVLIVAMDATKGRRERIVPMSAFVLAELTAYGLPGPGWMFPRRDGQRGPNQPQRVSCLANRHLHECGIPATLHQLRHRFGTQTYHVRRDLRATQELLGHTDPATTAGYAAYDQADAVETVNALPVPPRWRSGHLRAVGGAS